MKRYIFIPFAAVVLSIAGCRSLESMAPVVEGPVAQIGQAAGRDPATLISGRQLYLGECSSCHNLEPVDAHSAAQWEKILPRMSKEAKLSETEGQSIRAYVLTARAWVDQPKTK